jgi:hypothetical protein
MSTGDSREVGGEHSSWDELTTHMLSAVILSILCYPVFIIGTITSTPEVRPSRSSRTRERSSQCSNTHTRYGPNCLTMFRTSSRTVLGLVHLRLD